MSQCEMCSSYLRILRSFMVRLSNVQCAHLIYVINILVSIYAVNLSHRAFSNSLPWGSARERSEWFIFVIIGNCVTQIRARLSARWKRKPRVGLVGFARRKKKKKKTAPTRRGDNLAEGKKGRGRPFYRDNCTTRAGAYTSLHHVANFSSVILSLQQAKK